MFSNLFQKTFRDQRWSIFWWSTGFLFISFYLSYFYPYFSGNSEIFKVIKTLPPVLKNFLGDLTNLASPEGFFSLQPFMFFAPVFVIIFSISKGGDVVAGEVGKGTLDVLLSKPISRAGVIFEKTMASVLSLFLIDLIFFISFFISLHIFKIKIDVVNLASIIFSLFLLSLSFFSISVFIGVISLKKKVVNGVVGGLAFVSLIFNSYASAVKSLKTISYFTPFYYYNGNSPLVNGLDPKYVLIQASIAAIFFAFSILLFKKRDLFT